MHVEHAANNISPQARALIGRLHAQWLAQEEATKNTAPNTAKPVYETINLLSSTLDDVVARVDASVAESLGEYPDIAQLYVSKYLPEGASEKTAERVLNRAERLAEFATIAFDQHGGVRSCRTAAEAGRYMPKTIAESTAYKWAREIRGLTKDETKFRFSTPSKFDYETRRDKFREKFDEHYLSNKSAREIAVDLGVSTSTVYKYARLEREERLRSALDKFYIASDPDSVKRAHAQVTTLYRFRPGTPDLTERLAA